MHHWLSKWTADQTQDAEKLMNMEISRGILSKNPAISSYRISRFLFIWNLHPEKPKLDHGKPELSKLLANMISEGDEWWPTKPLMKKQNKRDNAKVTD